MDNFNASLHDLAACFDEHDAQVDKPGIKDDGSDQAAAG